MRSSQSGLFILVDYPLTSILGVREIYHYIYKKTYNFRKIGASDFLCCLIAMFVVKKTGFKIGQQKISPPIITGPLHFQ